MYVGRVLADRPYGFWSLDSASPFVDVSGNSHNATASGSYKYSNTLVAGGGRSLVVNSSYIPSFNFPLLVIGYEHRSWTWEVWFHPLQTDQSISILKHEAAELSYNGALLMFTMQFADATVALLEYEVLTREAMHIVVTHTANRVSMFVNGTLVASDEIEDTQNEAGYDIGTPSTSVTSGNGTTDQILIDSVAFYGFDLGPAKIRTHYAFGRDVSTMADVVVQNYGYYCEPSDATSNVYLQAAWDTDQDFNTSPLTDVIISGGLKPGIDDVGDPVPSSWVMPINMNAIDPTTVEYVRIGWVGVGVVEVELRTDGLTWIPVTNDKAIFVNEDVNEKIYELRVSFDGTDEDAEIGYLDFTCYRTNELRGSLLSRDVTYDGIVTIARTSNEPIEHNLKRGADISGGGRLYASPDQEASPINTKTIEVWANFLAASSFTIFDMRSVGNTGRPYLDWNGSGLVSQGIDKLYVNGVLVTIGSWAPTSPSSVLFTAVLTTADNYGSYFGSAYTGAANTNGQVESFAFYETESTATNILRMYNSYYGIVADVVDDASVININEVVDPYEIYSYPWSITGAG
jgi:Concanavalin A-like lectin/glucanases superfamily